MLERLGRGVHRRRAVVLTAWLVLVALGSVLGGSVFDQAEEVQDRAGTESAAVDDRLREMDPEGVQVVAVLRGPDALAVDLVDQASRVLHGVRQMPGVAEVRDPYTSGAAELFSDDGQGAVVQVELAPVLEPAEVPEVAERVSAELRTIAVPTVLLGGEHLAEEAFAEQAVRDAARGEGGALLVLLVVLVVVLGGWVVGAAPLVTALAAVAGSLLALTGLVSLVPVNEYAVNVVTILGLGLAVDYSLLLVARFREERAATGTQRDLPAVLARTVATAGRTVLVSGLTVACSMTGLLVLGDPLLTGMALGGVVAVAVATVAALTLTPALLATFHRHIPPPRRQPRQAAGAASSGSSLLVRMARLAQRRPWPVLVASSGLLLLLAAPVLALETGSSDARSLPATSEPRLAHEAIQAHHSELRTTPITVLVDVAPDDPRVVALGQQLSDRDGVSDVLVLDPLPDGTTELAVEPRGETFGATAQRLVTELRTLDSEVPLLVGGPAAELVDARSATTERLPWAVLVVASVTGLLLLALTGSVVVPLKTLALNLLSLSATLGVVVAVFQWGWGSSLLGFTPWGAVDLTTPLLLFMFAFGLSMDYHVFLVARIKEEWDAPPTGRRAPAPGTRAANDRAVLAGIAGSGPVVTLAAVAISIVFLGFAAGQLVAVKEIGVGMVVAIVLDVTVVRGLMLPAAMTLLGRWNWWRPGLEVPGRH